MMKKQIFAALLLILSATSTSLAVGLPCEKLEYAELKDMDKASLSATLCSYKRRTEANQDLVRQYEDYAALKQADICLDELIRVERLYKKEFKEDPPECIQ